jgi:2-methylcitrate dehydratase PrpD
VIEETGVHTRDDTITGGRMVTRELAAWVAGLVHDDLPHAVVEEAGRAFVDFLGECLFVGATKPWGRSIAEFCASDGGLQPQATIIASGKKTLSSRAALANGTMALGFEYADFGVASRPYPFAVTAPLALAESRRRSGKDLVLGIVIGYEVMARVLRATSQRVPGQDLRAPQSRFYVPALYGTFGSAAGSARVLGLSPEHTNYALGLAAAFTGGTFQGHEEGAWQRSLNGGMASERGATAALLAETGFKATEMGLEGVQAFAVMFCDGRLDPSALLDDLGSSYVITQRWVKAYPMNVTLHAPVEALLRIMRENDLEHTDIEQVDAAWQFVEPFLAKPQVTTVVGAQASLPFALSVAAVRGKVGVDEFTDETVADPVIQAMIPRMTVHQDDDLYLRVENSMPGRVTVRTVDGRTLTAEVLYPKGNPENPMTADDLKGKFMDMAVRVLGQSQSEELYERARDLEGVDDVADLARLFSPHDT